MVACLDELYDPRSADDWDAVGTVCGDPAQPVRTILFAVDPVLAVVEEAVQRGGDLVVTHHPLLLRAVHSVAATTPKGRVLHRLIRNDIALHVCHTNADSADPGVSDAVARVLGLTDVRPLDADPEPPMDKLVTFVPHADAQRIIDALAAAGAGVIGDYDRCAWTASGVGTFRPGAGTNPAIGSVGAIERVDETRVEMVLPRARRQTVIEALRGAHPYEEPALDLFETAELPSTRGTGRVGVLPEPTTLRGFVERVAGALPATTGGVRVAGDPEQPVRTVALCGGAGDAFLGPARASGADVYVTSDLRHHPASELREWAYDDQDAAPALVDVSHWAAEWTWLPDAADRLASALAERGSTVDTHVSRINTDPWAFQIASPATEGSPR
ncbi:MAG: Nif3-like dinuclear metal center hexameric protein [Propionibacteriales bacterium]|nr:Nif3-like dinuclear metal center hexameric protein [Propionibacteriales bacterium]